MEDDYHLPTSLQNAECELINNTTSHANIIGANQTFSVDDKMTNIAAPFFDIEDDYHVQVDLWLISSIGVELMDLLYGVNQTRSAIEFTQDFPEYLHHIVRQNDALHAEITSTPRYKRAMAISQRGSGKSMPRAAKPRT
jgi:hypothetical protein